MNDDALTAEPHAGRLRPEARRRFLPDPDLPTTPESGRPRPEEDDHRAYAGGRIGARPLVAVTFRLSCGREVSFAYSHLYGVDGPCPNAGFVADFTRHRVTVAGRGLARVFALLADHRVREVVQTDEAHALGLPAGEPVVIGLTVEEKQGWGD